MHATINTNNLRLSSAMRDRIYRRLNFTLGRFSGRIQAVTVALSDENARRGGIDKRCRILVHVRGGDDVIVEREGEDLDGLVSATANRAGQALARELDRRRTKPWSSFGDMPNLPR